MNIGIEHLMYLRASWKSGELQAVFLSMFFHLLVYEKNTTVSLLNIMHYTLERNSRTLMKLSEIESQEFQCKDSEFILHLKKGQIFDPVRSHREKVSICCLNIYKDWLS